MKVEDEIVRRQRERARVTALLRGAFVVLLFSPVQFPISRLPIWLADVHRVLPIYYLGQVLRASVTRGLVSNLALSYAVLAAWTAAAWAGAAWVVARRR